MQNKSARIYICALFVFLAYISAMNEEYLESLAKAYNKQLYGEEVPLLTQSIEIINEQIYLLSRLNQKSKIVGYVISLKECVKNLINPKEKPSRRTIPKEGGINRIINLELELLCLLDDINEPNTSKILEYENRALALLCYLVK